MGVDYSAKVIWGVPETKAMRKARKVMKYRTIYICKKHGGEAWLHERFCSSCGGALESESERYYITKTIAEAYAPDEQKDNEDWEFEENCIVIQTDHMNGDGYFFGFVLASSDIVYDDQTQKLRRVSPEMVEELDEFLDRIGHPELDADFYLVPCVS